MKSCCYAQFHSKAVYSFNQTFIRTMVSAGLSMVNKTELVPALKADSLLQILSKCDLCYAREFKMEMYFKIKNQSSSIGK